MTDDDARAANVQLALRLPQQLLGRVDAHAEHMRAASPGVSVTRSDAMRALLIAALDQAEKNARRRRT